MTDGQPVRGLELGVDAWRLRGERTGIFRYLSSILRYWTPDALSERFAEVTLYSPRCLDTEQLTLPPNLRDRRLPPDLPMRLWQNVLLGPAASDDVLWCPAFSRPLVTRARATVVTSHESIAAIHPEMYGRGHKLLYERHYAWSARHATLVIADTVQARDDIVAHWGVEPHRVRVVYLAAADVFRPCDHRRTLEDARVRLFGSDIPFFLFVGKLSGRRSVPLLLDAFAEFKRRTELSHKLVIAGPNPRQLDLTGMAALRGVADSVRYLGWVPDPELNVLYNASEAYVSSAVYEPVSIPVMEAQAVGTPVIAVDCPGIREYTGGEALLLSSPDAREMAEALAGVARDETLRRELAARGRANAARFSWERTSHETLAVLSRAARSSESVAR